MCVSDRREPTDHQRGHHCYATIGEARAVARGLNQKASGDVLYYAAPLNDLWPHDAPFEDDQK